jgi:hypothetical protein
MRWKAIKPTTLSVLLGHNLPFLLWTGWAGFLALTGLHPSWTCPIRGLLHFCPGCGLTGSYVELLSGSVLQGAGPSGVALSGAALSGVAPSGAAPPAFLFVVLGLFVLNSAWSVFIAFRGTRTRSQ